MLRYVDNPNGSIDDIAGVCNEGRNVVGLMPHPERASSELLGSADGRPLLSSVLARPAQRLTAAAPADRRFRRAGQPPRVMPAAFSVGGSTPSSRQAA